MRRRKRILITAAVLAVLAALSGQYTMWQRYGVFDWWSAQPEFLKLHGRDYERAISTTRLHRTTA
ncbi:hypothetical protein [Mycobacterium sp. 141]|uniref:hypothetical protein n=1 Tax=Mycobacterium sp. 141 TaxID=1120797 RepID=UPI0012DDF822|nr:hypothetical protein [Mycobacterium sp. 141]